MRVYSCVFALVLVCCGVSSKDDWSYLKEREWGGVCETGSRQSPINVESGRTVGIDKDPLTFEGYMGVEVRGVNTGRMIQFVVTGNQKAPRLSGGPLDYTYALDRVEVHWMAEHTIDDYKHPLEIQLVHRRSDVAPDDVEKHNDSIAIVAVHYELSIVTYRGNTSSMSPSPAAHMVELMAGLLNEYDERMDEKLDVLPLLGNYESYFTYKGSLTTPECHEVVIWIILDTTLHITDLQYKKLSAISIGGAMNYRAVQPRNARTVYRSVCRGPLCIEPMQLKQNSGDKSKGTMREYILVTFAALMKVLFEMTTSTLL